MQNTIHSLTSRFTEQLLLQTPPPQSCSYLNVVPLLAMVVIFYFLLIRPQQKQAKLHKQFVDALKRGDDVVTQSGIFGKIYAVEERFCILEIGEGGPNKVRMKMLKSQIYGKSTDESSSPEPEKTANPN